MNSHNSGSTVPLIGTPVSSSLTSGTSAVTVVNNGPGLLKGHANAIMPPSNTVIQTSFVNSQNVVTSSQAASLGGGPTVTLVRPSMQTAGSGTTSNGNNNMASPLVVNVANQPGTTTPAMTIQSPLMDNGQSPASVSVSAGSQIIKAEAPKTIIQTAPQSLTSGVAQNTDNLTHSQQQQSALQPGMGIIKNPVLQSAPRTFTPVTGAGSPGGVRAVAPQVLAPRLPQTSPNQPNVQNIQLPPGLFTCLRNVQQNSYSTNK